MGSYKWGYKSPNMSYIYSYPNHNPPPITTHEPPSTVSVDLGRDGGAGAQGRGHLHNSTVNKGAFIIRIGFGGVPHNN